MIMNGETLKAGDQVMLKIGGPWMYVRSFENDNQVVCTWIDNNKVPHSEIYPSEWLTKDFISDIDRDLLKSHETFARKIETGEFPIQKGYDE